MPAGIDAASSSRHRRFASKQANVLSLQYSDGSKIVVAARLPASSATLAMIQSFSLVSQVCFWYALGFGRLGKEQTGTAGKLVVE
jgi:hypothetical protein